MSSSWFARFPDEASACPACRSTRIQLIDAIPTLRDAQGRYVSFITGCHDCGLLFTNPVRTAEELQKYYEEDGAWADIMEARRLRGKARERVRKPMTARDRLLIALEPYVPVNSPPAGARVLDFGCGDGKFLDRLQNRGWETYGIEPAMSVAFTRHRRLEVPPPDPTFDFIIVHHVLEHVPEPLDLLRQLGAATRPGGVLFISLPRLDTVAEHGHLKYCLDGRKHLVSFSETCLSGLLARSGFATTARLDARELDDALTKGQPLRLRLVATRTDAPPPPVSRPLAAARAALQRYERVHVPPLDRLTRRLVPVRVRAANLDRERRAAKEKRKAA
jgi:SAM-dependent methyltransferase